MNSDASGQRRKLVLCFDGTGNKFRGDDSDSNILKIYRMLDRTRKDQYHYYQPGIGTYVIGSDVSHTGLRARVRLCYLKAKDSAVGSSFAHHVLAGYRFLMRFYSAGDDVYMFGFSRGAYVARFLAEMLDYVGLLSHGNEEMVDFAWDAFSRWQAGGREPTADGRRARRDEYRFLRGFRETFSRPVRRIRFLGLFDTVNSVPRFEAAWMGRSRFPYTARTSARLVRHAVSIDERRAKFRQDLLYQTGHAREKRAAGGHGDGHDGDHGSLGNDGNDRYRGRRTPSSLHVPDDQLLFRTRPRSARSRSARSRTSQRTDASAEHTPDAASDLVSETPLHQIVHQYTDADEDEDVDEDEQDIDEVWFAGGHGDVGGGWEVVPGSKSASHVPLTWMVREAMRAGLAFDPDKLVEMGCCDGTVAEAAMPAMPAMPMTDTPDPDAPDVLDMPAITVRSPSDMSSPAAATTAASPLSLFQRIMQQASLARLHDSLSFDCGAGLATVLAWRAMEYLPFRRMDMRADGSWRPIRWPLPCGETRDVPPDARVHGSVIRRMRCEPSYRPGNLIVGGGGRGVRRAPPELGIGHWRCVANPGDDVSDIWVRAAPKDR